MFLFFKTHSKYGYIESFYFLKLILLRLFYFLEITQLLFQVVALATYVGSLVPRTHLLAEAATQGMFMVAMYQLFCLFVAYCGGEAELIRKVKPDVLNPKVGPCCCWPCCCLPHLEINKYISGRYGLY